MADARPDHDRQIARLGEAVARLEMRVRALESTAGQDRADVAVTQPAESHLAPNGLPAPQGRPAASGPPDGVAGSMVAPRVPAAGIFTLLGRSILVLAGAFLLRLLTDTGALPPLLGVNLGMGYALLLILLAHRAAGREGSAGAVAYGMTAAVVIYPLLWETTARLHILSAGGGAAALAAVTAAGLLAAWHRRLRLLAWTFTLAALCVGVGLAFATAAQELYAAVLLALGVATTGLAYTRHWHLKRWFAASAADALILRLTVMAADPQAAGRQGLSVGAVQALALALLVAYLGVFAYRALVMGRGVRVFDVCQSALVVAIGFGGAARIAQTWDRGTGLLGWAALLAALAGYTVAFTVVRQRHGRGRGFFYFAWLALVFLFLGSRLVAQGPWLGWFWILLGLTAAGLGGHFDRVTLRAHAVVYLALATVRTGLGQGVLDAFLAPADTTWSAPTLPGAVCLAAVAACYLMLIVLQKGRDLPVSRLLPRFFAAVLALLGLGYLAVVLLVGMMTPAPPGADPAVVALVRTAVLALTAVVLGMVVRRGHLRELAWLVHPILVVGIGKLVVEDLRRGTPLTLTLGFGLFGAALVLAPRLLRGARRAA